MSDALFVFGGRGSGKTAKVIEFANRTGSTVVVPDRRSADNLRNIAFAMGIPNLNVRTLERACSCTGCMSVCVDDAESILERVIGCPVTLATFDASRIDMRKMTFIDMLAEWRRQRRIEKCGGDAS